MPASITMTDKQKVGAGISLLDADGQAFAQPPEGTTVTFESSDSAVASVSVDPLNPFNIEVGSGLVGAAIITATVQSVDLPGPLTDTLAVAVTNSAPGSLNFTVGTPIDE